MNFEHFVCKVDSEFLLNRSAGIRYGQTIMNVLGEVWPEKYEEIIATDFDCFYVDSMAQNTLVKLEADWASRTQTGRTMMSFLLPGILEVYEYWCTSRQSLEYLPPLKFQPICL